MTLPIHNRMWAKSIYNYSSYIHDCSYMFEQNGGPLYASYRGSVGTSSGTPALEGWNILPGEQPNGHTEGEIR